MRILGAVLDRELEERERLGELKFLGEPLSLPAAVIELTDAGEARLEAIGDYRAPWR